MKREPAYFACDLVLSRLVLVIFRASLAEFDNVVACIRLVLEVAEIVSAERIERQVVRTMVVNHRVGVEVQHVVL